MAPERITKLPSAKIAKVAALVAVLIVAVVIGAIIVPKPSQHTYVPTPQVAETPQAPPPYVRLRVEAYETEAHWTRDYSTDLPFYISVIVYAAYNDGTAQADSVLITITVDGSVFQEFSTYIGSGSYTSGNFQLSFGYDTSHEVSVSASHRQSTDTKAISINAILPRSTMTADIWKLFVTPNDPVVKNTLDLILRSYPLVPKWMAIRDWVASNIQYAYDDQVYGGNYWQLPRETLQHGTGDCEDYAILLVSLYRAVGYDDNRVFVVLGYTSRGYHGWAKIHVDVIGWRYIEPQEGGILAIIDIFGSVSASEFTPQYEFNDIYAYQVT